MTEPESRDVPAEDLDEKGLDRRGLEETLREIDGAIQEMIRRAREFGDALITGSSADGQVTVWTTRTGLLRRIRLHDGVTRDFANLGARIAQTISDTQRRGRDEYERAVAQIVPPPFVVTDRGMRRSDGRA